jgi:hypothetical protein
MRQSTRSTREEYNLLVIMIFRILPFSCGIPDISVSITLSPVCKPCLVSSKTVTRAGESLEKRRRVGRKKAGERRKEKESKRKK